MSIKSVVLLKFSPFKLDYASDPIKASGYYNSTIGLTTIQIQTLNFQGRLYIEGSNVLEPTDNDWFPIQLNPNEDYIQYPRSNYSIYGSLTYTSNPTVQTDWYSIVGVNGESSTLGFTFYLNCLYLRARFNRSYFLPEQLNQAQIEPFGSIDSILVNFS